MKRIAFVMAAVILTACLLNPDKAAETLAIAAPGALVIYAALRYFTRRTLRYLDAELAETVRVQRERVARERRIQDYLNRGAT